MEKIFSLAIAVAGVAAGVLVAATGEVADGITPLLLALAGAAALRLQPPHSRSES